MGFFIGFMFINFVNCCFEFVVFGDKNDFGVIDIFLIGVFSNLLLFCCLLCFWCRLLVGVWFWDVEFFKKKVVFFLKFFFWSICGYIKFFVKNIVMVVVGCDVIIK